MQKLTKGKYDFLIFITVIILVLFGCVMVYSASYYSATIEEGDAAYYFKKQILGAVLGFAAMLFMANFNFQRIDKVKIPLAIVTIGLLLMVFTPLGITLNGARRWVNLGVTTMQPSELCKITVVVLLSSYFAKNREKISTWTGGIIPAFAISAAMCIPIILQPNLSMVLCIMITTFIMLFACGANKKHLMILCLAGLAAVAVLIIIEPYRLKRLFVFLDPWSDTQGDSWQLIQSYYAIGSGGLFGKGLVSEGSFASLGYIPDDHTDMIFAIVCEAFGFVGGGSLILAYLLLIFRLVQHAIRVQDAFGSYIIFGVTAMLLFHIVENICMVIGLLPVTGIPLPFVSYGGSSYLTNILGIGLVQNVVMREKRNPVPNAPLRAVRI